MGFLLRILCVLVLMGGVLGAAGCDRSSPQPDTADTTTGAQDNPTPDPDPDPAPDPQPMSDDASGGSDEAGDADEAEAFERKFEEAMRLAADGETRSALILARMMQQRFAEHPRINELIALERRLNEQRDLEAQLAVPLRNLAAEDPDRVRAARQMLRRAGDAATPLVRKLARQPDQAGSREALRLLAQLRDPAALPLIIRRLETVGEDTALAEELARLTPDAAPDAIADLYRLFERAPGQPLVDALAVAYQTHAGGDAGSFNQLADDPEAFETLAGFVSDAIETGDDSAVDWAMRHAETLRVLGPGLRARFYTGTDLDGELLADVKVDRPRVHDASDLPGGRTTNISARWTGKIRIESPGRYTFLPTADDGQRVIVNGKMIVDDWHMHGPKEVGGDIDLEAGLHDLEVRWMQGGGGYKFTLRWKGPGFERQEIPPDRFRVIPWKGMEEQ